MSDCRHGGRDVYAAPKAEEREPGVLYQHPLYSHEYYEGLLAIQVSGIRFYREDFEVVYDLKDGKITGVTVEGLHFTIDKEAAR